MRQLLLRKLLIALAVISFSNFSHGQTTLFSETFDEPVTSATGSSLEGIGWTASCPTCPTTGIFDVRAASMYGRNTDGPAVWQTDPIDVSNCKSFGFTSRYIANYNANLEDNTECGTCNGDPVNPNADCNGCWDYTLFELLLDNVSVDSELYGSGNNPAGFENVSLTSCSAGASNAVLKVTMQNDADDNTEVQRFDNVVLVCFEENEHQVAGKQTICDSALGTELYSVTPAVPFQTYLWSTTGGVGGAQNFNSSYGVNWTGVAPGSYTVSVDITDPNGCMMTMDHPVYIAVDQPYSMTCNGLVNLTLDENCSLDFLQADMFLESMLYANDGYTVSTFDLTDSSIDPSADPSAYLGQTIGIKIEAVCGGNSCWSTAHIEDKSIPPLVCAPLVNVDCEDIDTQLGFPSNIGAYLPSSTTPGSFNVFGYDNCGDAVLSYVDNVISSDCSNPTFSAVLERTWTIIDGAGNSSTCVTTINVNPSDLSDITFPPHFDPAFGTDALDPQSCASWPTLYNGHPDPSFTGMPTGDFCLNVEIDFHDTRFDGCNDENFKILREWTVTDICSTPPMTLTYVQNIVVMDNNPPIITCPIDAAASIQFGYDVSSYIGTTNNYDCTADWAVVPPTIINECSAYTWIVEYIHADENGEAPVGAPYISTDVSGTFPNYTISDLPMGNTWLRYTVTDACGFTSQCFTEIIVYDDSDPQAVCDLHSNIALNNDQCAYATPATFDDGSFSCGEVDIAIRRAGSGAYSQEIKFTCADANSTVLIELQATSANGSTSVCIVEAFIQEPSTSSMTHPADMSVTLDCAHNLNLNNLDPLFGAATVTQSLCNAGSINEETAILDLDECGNGRLTRKWRYVDQSGNVSFATQIITITIADPFNGNINWPGDVNLTGCRGTSALPDDIPGASNQRPTWNANNCGSIFANYEDTPFYFVEGVCVKILRKWTVVDWCQTGSVPGVGIWEYSQIIKISDNTVPSINSGCNLPSIVQGTEAFCGKIVSFSASATDNCPEELTWSVTINNVVRNHVDAQGTASLNDVPLSPGTHTICWNVEDACGNTDQCCDTFIIEDDKPPTPACISVLTTVISNSTGSALIWASDFEASSSDNCTNSTQLTYAFSTNPQDQSLSVSCSDIPNGVVDTVQVNVYVFDAAGNYDFCPALLVVQDNSDNCPDVNTGTRIDLSGNIETEFDDVVDEVMVTISSNDLPGFPSEYMAYDGIYAFSDLDMYNTYEITAEKNDEVMNGVSTLDLVLIQKHLLGIQELDSPYKIVAADINDSGDISAIDLVELRKLILGIFEEFPNNQSWRFLNSDQVFADVTSPFPFIEYVNYNSLDQDIDDADFVAVKIGDVNESVVANNFADASSNRSENIVKLNLAQAKTNSGNNRFDLSLENKEEIIGMQFTLQYDADKTSLEQITSEYLDITDVNYTELEKGIITFSWSDINGKIVDENSTMLSLHFNSEDSSDKVYITSAVTAAEIYTIDGNTTIVNGIELIDEKIDFVLHQNVPNPFKEETVIQFQLPQATAATISIFDANGKILFALTDEYSKGLNQVVIDGNLLPNSGILYYQLNSYTQSATKKLIVLK